MQPTRRRTGGCAYVDDGSQLLGDFGDVRRGCFPRVEEPSERCTAVSVQSSVA